MERPDQIFSCGMIDARLSANRAVRLRDERRWDLHEWEATQQCCCQIARQISHHTASKGNHQGLPVDGLLQRPVVHPAKHLGRFGRLSGRNGARSGSPAIIFKRNLQRPEVMLCNVLIRNEQRLAAPQSDLLKKLGRIRERGKVDAVASAVRQINRDE